MCGDGPSNLSKTSAPTTPSGASSKALAGGSGVGSSQNSLRQGSLALAQASQEATPGGGRTGHTPRSGRNWPVLLARPTCAGGPCPPRERSERETPHSASPARPTTGQLKLKQPETLIYRRLFNESARENIFAIKIAGAEFFKPPTEGKYKIIGRKTPRG
jgi:hypothetical protein